MKRITISILAIFIVTPSLFSEDKIFDALKFTYHSAAFLDYTITFHASHFPEYEERNVITCFYWRQPELFCAIKALETVVFDRLFTWIHSKSKILGYVAVIVFAAVRLIAVRDNLRILN